MRTSRIAKPNKPLQSQELKTLKSKGSHVNA